MGDEGPAGDEGAGEVDLDNPAPVLIGEFRGAPIGADTGVAEIEELLHLYNVLLQYEPYTIPACGTINFSHVRVAK